MACANFKLTGRDLYVGFIPCNPGFVWLAGDVYSCVVGLWWLWCSVVVGGGAVKGVMEWLLPSTRAAAAAAQRVGGGGETLASI